MQPDTGYSNQDVDYKRIREIIREIISFSLNQIMLTETQVLKEIQKYRFGHYWYKYKWQLNISVHPGRKHRVNREQTLVDFKVKKQKKCDPAALVYKLVGKKLPLEGKKDTKISIKHTQRRKSSFLQYSLRCLTTSYRLRIVRKDHD